MADDFDAAGVNNWWNMNTPRDTTTSTSSDISASSFDNSAAIQPSIADVGLHHIPGFTMDWNQSLLRSSTGCSGRAEPSFHAMLQDSYNYTSSIESGQFYQQQQQQQQVGLFPMLVQGLIEAPEETKVHRQPNFDPNSLSYSPPSSVTMMGSSISDSLQKLPQLLKSSPPAPPLPDQLQFSNDTAFWNASEARSSGFYSAAAQMPVQFEQKPSFLRDQKPSCSTSSRVSTTKSNLESAVSKRSGGSGSEPALKKTRAETPSPLPTFKVRKEKLGDRITALQQLVSPFGKTDTASVLHEAIEYIKFLHDQVNVLTTPYLKNGNPMQHQQSFTLQSSDKSSNDGDGGPKQDLRSRGLCLVPVESTYPVASETTPDFWTPTFGGSYR